MTDTKLIISEADKKVLWGYGWYPWADVPLAYRRQDSAAIVQGGGAISELLTHLRSLQSAEEDKAWIAPKLEKAKQDLYEASRLFTEVEGDAKEYDQRIKVLTEWHVGFCRSLPGYSSVPPQKANP